MKHLSLILLFVLCRMFAFSQEQNDSLKPTWTTFLPKGSISYQTQFTSDSVPAYPLSQRVTHSAFAQLSLAHIGIPIQFRAGYLQVDPIRPFYYGIELDTHAINSGNLGNPFSNMTQPQLQDSLLKQSFALEDNFKTDKKALNGILSKYPSLSSKNQEFSLDTNLSIEGLQTIPLDSLSKNDRKEFERTMDRMKKVKTQIEKNTGLLQSLNSKRQPLDMIQDRGAINISAPEGRNALISELKQGDMLLTSGYEKLKSIEYLEVGNVKPTYGHLLESYYPIHGVNGGVNVTSNANIRGFYGKTWYPFQEGHVQAFGGQGTLTFGKTTVSVSEFTTRSDSTIFNPENTTEHFRQRNLWSLGIAHLLTRGLTIEAEAAISNPLDSLAYWNTKKESGALYTGLKFKNATLGTYTLGIAHTENGFKNPLNPFAMGPSTNIKAGMEHLWFKKKLRTKAQYIYFLQNRSQIRSSRMNLSFHASTRFRKVPNLTLFYIPSFGTSIVRISEFENTVATNSTIYGGVLSYGWRINKVNIQHMATMNFMHFGDATGETRYSSSSTISIQVRWKKFSSSIAYDQQLTFILRQALGGSLGYSFKKLNVGAEGKYIVSAVDKATMLTAVCGFSIPKLNSNFSLRAGRYFSQTANSAWVGHAGVNVSF